MCISQPKKKKQATFIIELRSKQRAACYEKLQITFHNGYACKFRRNATDNCTNTVATGGERGAESKNKQSNNDKTRSKDVNSWRTARK